MRKYNVNKQTYLEWRQALHEKALFSFFLKINVFNHAGKNSLAIQYRSDNLLLYCIAGS